MNVVLKIFVRPEIFLYIAVVAFAGLFFTLKSYNTNASFDFGLAQHYFSNLSEARIVWVFILFLVALFLRGIVLWIRAFLRGTDPAIVFSRKNITVILLNIRSLGKSALVVGIPAVVAFYSTSSAIGQLNIFNSTRLRDELLFRFDILLTGTFPPLAVGSFSYPSWFIGAVNFSFMHLVWVLLVFGAYLFIAHQQLFREAIGAFFLGLMILYAGWLIFPVLSPHDRFIDNVYELPTVEAVQPYVNGYRPQEEIAAFLEGMRERKEDLSVLPTSTFPSAHVAWATILVYYAWRLWPWLGLIAFPFAVVSSLGTFLFAQHYFVDLPAGILVSAISIWVVYWFAKKQGGYNEATLSF